MFKLLEYYGRFERVRGSFGQLPAWGRMILMVVALPGIVLLGLSVLAFFVSLVALLLLTVPVYRLLAAVTGGGQKRTELNSVEAEAPASSGRRHVDVTIIEEEPRA